MLCEADFGGLGLWRGGFVLSGRVLCVMTASSVWGGARSGRVVRVLYGCGDGDLAVEWSSVLCAGGLVVWVVVCGGLADGLSVLGCRDISHRSRLGELDMTGQTREGHEEKCFGPSGWRRLQHPLVVACVTVLLTSLCASIVVPFLNRGKLRQEAKKELVLAILRHHCEIEQSLNSLITTLEMYQKKNLVCHHLQDLGSVQMDLRKRMRGSYLTFDRAAWFWHGAIIEKIKWVGLEDKKQVRMKELLGEFMSSLADSTRSLDRFWNLCLSKEYDPHSQEAAECMKQTRAQLGRDMDRRGAMTGMMIEQLEM